MTKKLILLNNYQDVKNCTSRKDMMIHYVIKSRRQQQWWMAKLKLKTTLLIVGLHL